MRNVLVLLTIAGWLLSSAVAGAVEGVEEVDLVIRGGTVVAMDEKGSVVEHGAVAVRGEKIVGVGTEAELAAKYRGKRTLDATGKVVMPGLVNTHTHVPMVLFRGIADDLPLMQWLNQHIFPAEAKNVDEEFVRWGTRLGCLEMILGGTTTFVDMYYFEDAIADETAKAGMRGVLGETVVDFAAPDNKNWGDALAYCEGYVRKWKKHALITPAIAPHAVYTVSGEHLKEAHGFAEQYDVPLLIHLSESQIEMNLVREKHGVTPVAYLEGLGLLDKRVVAAHLIYANDNDIAVLARRGVGAAHCPQSNMKIAEGTAPVPQMLRAGIAVGLGTDGAASNNDLNMWEEMDTAAKLHKLIAKDPTVLGARQVLEMATIGGARAIGLEKEIGSLEVGKRADVIVVRMDGPHQTPMYNVGSLLVYATKASDVETVVVNGQVVMEGRRVLTIDEHEVIAKAREYGERIRGKAVGGGR
jgi:5-methylthioadenosine/S-adenosylhomocysteine deaminase